VSPLPGWKVIPDNWAARLAPTVNATLTSEANFYRITAGPAPFPKPVGWTGKTLLHTTFVRVQELNREGGGTPGEQPTRERQYLIVAPLGIPALQTGERGDIIAAVGREFRVQQVMFGTNVAEVDILCTDNLTQQNPA
jgi:hypothetical protein